ncbi:MAG: His/Gly/Thr/Pro-type tRNA ligase C-terminal domain-containing protein [Candidatus Paceibacterota bacterium]|jgi:histidyl-tRNA synthetase
MSTSKKKPQKKDKAVAVPEAPTKKKPVEISPELETAAETARHFGFIPLPPIEIDKSDIVAAKRFDESHLAIVKPWTEECDRFAGYLEEKIAIMRNITDKKWSHLGIPLMGYYEGPAKGNPHLKRISESRTFNLEVIGMSKPIAEAMIIETAYVILKDRYPDEELMLELNSIGDKESMARFARELQNYCKKEMGALPADLKTEIKKDMFSVFTMQDERAQAFVDGAPKPMAFLSDVSRNHFKEVLEYIESLEIPYEINHKLIGSRSYCSDTIFEIRGKKDVLAIGERYNTFAKKVWGKKDVPALGCVLLMHPHFVTKMVGKKNTKEEEAKFYFIQFGADAKRKSLAVINEMRKARIAVHQALAKDKLSVQLATAEKMNIPYIIMMGQKEAIEESVVVRNMQTRAQETIHISLLITHLKRLK